MARGKLKNPIFLFYALVAYVLLQFSWWLYLIFSLYKDIYIDEQILEKKLLMLAGEGIVFLVILILGVLMIRRAFRKEKELNKQHENFLMSVSHELKTPISSVKLYLQTLSKRELEKEKREDIYTRSLTEVNRLDNLVANILLTKNISNNNYLLKKEPLQLNELIEEIVSGLRSSLLAEHSVKLGLETLKLEIDKEAFISILTNLIENAVKYTPKNGEITVNLHEKEGKVIVNIIDNGPGISEDQHENVFSIFYRVDNELTRQTKGTGLGLYITRSLVEAHGGKIRLKNAKPNGLNVEIIFNK